MQQTNTVEVKSIWSVLLLQFNGILVDRIGRISQQRRQGKVHHEVKIGAWFRFKRLQPENYKTEPWWLIAGEDVPNWPGWQGACTQQAAISKGEERRSDALFGYGIWNHIFSACSGQWQKGYPLIRHYKAAASSQDLCRPMVVKILGRCHKAYIGRSMPNFVDIFLSKSSIKAESSFVDYHISLTKFKGFNFHHILPTPGLSINSC